MKISEHDLQKAMLQRLAYCKDIYFIRNNVFVGKVIGNNGKVGWMRQGKEGSPDIILCKNGLWIGIEVKTLKGKQSPEQKIAEEEIRSAGGQYFIVRSIEEFENLLENI